jgi:hypothetical protein
MLRKINPLHLLSAATLLFLANCPPSIPGDLSRSPAYLRLADANSESPSYPDAGKVLDEFEGRYQVGTTTCTVKPIKMAFEIRWARGRGAMHFFFEQATPKGESVFVSEDLDHGVDRFIFEDSRYRSGKFIRADGKVFTVKRLR